MTDSDKALLVKILELDPVHQELAPALVNQYDELQAMCERAQTSLTTKDKVFFAFLWADEKPVLITPPSIAEPKVGDKVYLLYTKKGTRTARIGRILEFAGASEKGKVRIKVNGDPKKYREFARDVIQAVIPE